MCSNMETQLTRGMIDTIFEGRTPHIPPVLQILSVGRIPDDPAKCILILVSDGQWSTCFAALKTGLNSMVLSGEISQNCIVKINKWGMLNRNKYLLIQSLEVLQSGVDVGKRIGDPHPYKINKNKTAPTTLIAKSSYQPPVPLTTGAISDIIEGGSPEEPVLQILNITFHPCEKEKEKHIRIVMSDGQCLSNFGLLNTQLVDKIESGEISVNCIIKMDTFVYKTGDYNLKWMYILDLTVLKSGADVGQRIGNPQPMATELTRGVLTLLSEGGNPNDDGAAVLQVLGISDMEDYNMIVVSDGQWFNGCVMLSSKFDDRVTSGEINHNCIIQVNKWAELETHSQTLPRNLDDDIPVLVITDLIVLQSGDDVIQQIGDPIDISCDEGPSKWIMAFEKRGIYMKEAKHGIDKNIWYI